MIKKLTSTAVATLTILTMMNTGAVFADSKDANEKEPVALATKKREGHMHHCIKYKKWTINFIRYYRIF